jgi:hypothetical protein
MTIKDQPLLDLQAAADEALREFAIGNNNPDVLSQIYEWLEADGWDALINDVGDQIAVMLRYIAENDFTDDEARCGLDLPNEVELKDSYRIKWARQRIERAQNGEDWNLGASLHTYKLIASDGSFAFIGCLIQSRGQWGDDCNWWGLWNSPQDFYDSVGKGGNTWVMPHMGEITDERILSMWGG